MNLKELPRIKSKLKEFLEDKEVIDVIIFGSFVKGKAEPADIDVLIITEKYFKKEIGKFHLNFMNLRELFLKFPLMMNTLLREGYSLKHNKNLSEYFRFQNKIIFSYSLKNLNASKKVKVVNILRGIGKRKGLVEESRGEWLANQVFIINPEHNNIFEKLLLNFKVKFTRKSVLID